MNLYLISQDTNSDYDTYDSAVVAAETPDRAALMHPSKNYDGTASIITAPDYYKGSTWVKDPALVTVTLIGVAVEVTPEGPILASYNGG